MGIDTKERILDVAERLFADFGFATTSLRDITREADVNLASVNYHFGSKEALLAAVLTRRFEPVNAHRIELLDELERNAGDDPPELEDVLRAFIGPPFEMCAGWGKSGQKFTRLLGRVHAETNDEFRKSFMRQFKEVFDRFTTALQRALPDVEHAEITYRAWFLIGSMSHTMMWDDTFGPHEGKRDAAEVLDSLIQFAAGGMSAPSRQPVAVAARRAGGRR